MVSISPCFACILRIHKHCIAIDNAIAARNKAEVIPCGRQISPCHFLVVAEVAYHGGTGKVEGFDNEALKSGMIDVEALIKSCIIESLVEVLLGRQLQAGDTARGNI